MSKMGSLSRGSAVALGLSLLGTATGFGLQLLLARSMGPDDFGIYVYAMGLMNVALIPAKLDLDNAATRYMGAYSGNGQWSKACGFARRVPRIVLSISIPFAALCAAALVVWSRADGRDLNAVYWVACCLLPITAVMQVQASMLQGLRRIGAAQAPPNLIRPAIVVLALGSMLLLGANISPAIVGGLNLAATLAVIVTQHHVIRRAIPKADVTAPDTTDVRDWLRTAVGLLAVSLSQFVLSGQTDIVLVGTLLTKADAGHYAIASQVAAALGMGFTAVVFVAAPQIAELHSAGSHASLQALVRKVGRISLMLTVPAVIAVILVGRHVLGLFGPTFVGALPVLILLSFVAVQGAAGGSVAGYLLSMTGHQVAGAVITGACALVYIVLALVLAPRLGATGIAMATLVGYLLRALALDLYIHRYLGIEVFPFGRAPRAPISLDGASA